MPYVVIDILGSGATIQNVTAILFPAIFPANRGGIPAWLGSGAVCLVVLTYVFGGGMRSLSFANALHATVLILLGGVILFLVLDKLGGAAAYGNWSRAQAGAPGPRRRRTCRARANWSS